jgi:hypothetical protein
MTKRRRKRASRAKHPGSLPRSAYRLPTGDSVVTGARGPPDKRGRRLRIRAVHRTESDVDKVAQALIAGRSNELRTVRTTDSSPPAGRNPGSLDNPLHGVLAHAKALGDLSQ